LPELGRKLYGVFGESTFGDGVNGFSSSGAGVYGASGSGSGVIGASTSVYGVHGNSTSGYGVFGDSTSGTGVVGASASNVGVYGITSSAGAATIGRSDGNGTGLLGASASGGPAPAAKAKTGVYGYAAQDKFSRGVTGESPAGIGVYGISSSGYGVYSAGKVYTTKWYEMTEVTTPAAPSANRARLFARDNGLGKTQLCVRFPTRRDQGPSHPAIGPGRLPATDRRGRRRLLASVVRYGPTRPKRGARRTASDSCFARSRFWVDQKEVIPVRFIERRTTPPSTTRGRSRSIRPC